MKVVTKVKDIKRQSTLNKIERQKNVINAFCINEKYKKCLVNYKKVILFGSEGNAKTFTSKYRAGEPDIGHWQKNNLPIAQTEVCDTIPKNILKFCLIFPLQITIFT